MMLYVHIPFCKRKCGYCDFLSFAGCDDKFMPYTAALCKEIALRSPGEKIPLTSVYIGGGTPSILPFNYLEKIFEAIREHFTLSDSCEITMELNPGTVNSTLVKTIQSLGVNRVSIGLQSADNDELKMLGRIHTFSDFLRSYEQIAKSDISNINVDLMTGIPKQSFPSLEKSLRLVTGLRPSHISTYALTLEEGTAFYRKYKKGAPPLPDDESEFYLYKLAINYLKDKGYERYEISNYAKDGYKSRHNLGYWERQPYIGVGLGASSFYNEHRLKNTSDMTQYLNMCQDNVNELSEDFFSEITKLSRHDQIEEFMYLGLRKMEGVSMADFERIFDEPMDSYYGETIDSLINEGLLMRTYGRVYLTDLGIDISNQVLSRFLFDYGVQN